MSDQTTPRKSPPPPHIFQPDPAVVAATNRLVEQSPRHRAVTVQQPRRRMIAQRGNDRVGGAQRIGQLLFLQLSLQLGAELPPPQLELQDFLRRFFRAGINLLSPLS